MTISENQIRMNSGKSRSQKLNFIESIFYPFLFLNFAVSVWFLKWKEDRYGATAASLTAWQFFFFISGVTMWVFPKIRNTSDIYWLLSTILFMSFASHFGLNKWLQYLINKSRLGSKISNKEKLQISKTLGLILFSLFLVGFVITVILKAYWYHTRFFWWNH